MALRIYDLLLVKRYSSYSHIVIEMRIIIPKPALELGISARLIRRHSGRQLRRVDSDST